MTWTGRTEPRARTAGPEARTDREAPAGREVRAEREAPPGREVRAERETPPGRETRTERETPAGREARAERTARAVPKARAGAGMTMARGTRAAGRRRICSRTSRRTGRPSVCRTSGTDHRRQPRRAQVRVPACPSRATGQSRDVRGWGSRRCACRKRHRSRRSPSHARWDRSPSVPPGYAAPPREAISSPGPSWSTGCRGPSHRRPRPACAAGPSRFPR